MSRRLSPDQADIAAEAIYADLDLPDGPADRPYVVLNMVATVDGKVAVGGRATGIGSRLDRSLMRKIRSGVDALMVGAATLRAEPVDPTVPVDLARDRSGRGLPPQPLAVTISRDLSLEPTHRFFKLGPRRCCVFTTSFAPTTRVEAFGDHARVERLGHREVDLVAALKLLRIHYGVRRLVVEGGPRLNQGLLDRNLVDEIFWTIAPKLAGGHGPGLLDGPRPPESIAALLTLISLYEDDSELFARYRLAPR